MADRSFGKEYADELRARFVKYGADNLTDTELLSLLLSFTALKSKLREVTANLVERFGTAKACYGAGYAELMGVDGMTRHGAVLIMLIGRLASFRTANSVRARSSGEYEEQFFTLLRYTLKEELWAAALDDEGAVCALERLSHGSEVNVELSVGELVRFTVKNNTKRVIIAHSHPDATLPVESETDAYSRKYLANALGAVGVELVGQVIVGGGRAKMYHIAQNADSVYIKSAQSAP